MVQDLRLMKTRKNAWHGLCLTYTSYQLTVTKRSGTAFLRLLGQ